MRKLLIILLSIFLRSNLSFSQDFLNNSIYDNFEFYQYLVNNQLYDDALTLLKNVKIENSAQRDSINTFIGNLYLIKDLPDSTNLYFKKVLSFPDSSILYKALALSFSLKDTSGISHFINTFRKSIDPKDLINFQFALDIMKANVKDSVILRIVSDQQLWEIGTKYISPKKKSAIVAGILSGLIPGLGKIYLGFKSQGKSALLVNITLAAIFTEIILLSPQIIPVAISGSVFLAFYGGNIVGTIKLSKKRNIDFQNQINEEIADYYRSKLLAF